MASSWPGVLRWEEPPAEHGNARPRVPSKFQPVVDDLLARRGEWGVVAEGKTPGAASNFAHRIKSGVGAFAPLGSFEARVVGPAGGASSRVYARYVGHRSVGRAARAGRIAEVGKALDYEQEALDALRRRWECADVAGRALAVAEAQVWASLHQAAGRG